MQMTCFHYIQGEVQSYFNPIHSKSKSKSAVRKSMLRNCKRTNNLPAISSFPALAFLFEFLPIFYITESKKMIN